MDPKAGFWPMAGGPPPSFEPSGLGPPPIGTPVPVKRRHASRWRLNPNALTVLEAAFQRSNFPTLGEKDTLAVDLNVSRRQVQVWFQNRRQRAKAKETAGIPGSTQIADALLDFVSGSDGEGDELADEGGASSAAGPEETHPKIEALSTSVVAAHAHATAAAAAA
ncbi:Homeodomain-like protein, partial [Pavlovales sp. CCMP2436]